MQIILFFRFLGLAFTSSVQVTIGKCNKVYFCGTLQVATKVTETFAVSRGKSGFWKNGGNMLRDQKCTSILTMLPI